ncbi:MAG: ABC-F family ATP-binding cassette domain-containing protein [Clostridia bacterium]|nr:ABC-F family ATP-binding cassette domain-containing protein [Clostridia bacterium]
MVVLSLTNVNKSFVMNRVLTDVNLSVQKGGRLGLVGVNGSGKSTLLKLINGDMQPDSGSISIPRGTSVGLLTQKADILGDQTVLEELSRVFDPLKDMEKRLRQLEDEIANHQTPEQLDSLNKEYARVTEKFEREGGYEWPSRIQGVLAGLKFARDRQDQKASVLSGGEKTRLCLARILLKNPDILLLDEPTNHLDLESVAWLEETLKKYRGTVVIISHDRYFLNALCDSIAEISMTRLTQYPGNYDRFVTLREENLTRQIKEYKMQQAEIARHEAIIARYKSFNREKSIIAARSWEKKLDKIEQNLLDRPIQEKQVRFTFNARRRSGDDVLFVRDVSKSFGERTLFQNFSLSLHSGDRVALIGPNGIGKTTLLKIIIGRLKPDGGTVVFGSNVDCGYYDQQQEGLNPNKTAMDEVWDTFPRMEPGDVRSALALFLMTGEDVFQKIETMSGGEKGRVEMAKLMLRRDNLLILDEPTNHLDMDTREVLEHALEDFDGTILAVSHDRYFINRVCDHVLEMSADGAKMYDGNYDEYLRRKARVDVDDGFESSGMTKTEIDKQKRRERQLLRERETLKQRVRQLEGQITGAEKQISLLEQRMSLPETYQDGAVAQDLARQYDRAKRELDELYDEWALASEQAQE